MFKTPRKFNFSNTDLKVPVLLFLLVLILRTAYALFHYFSFGPPPTNAYFEIATIMLEEGRLFYEATHPYYESAAPLLPWINAVTMFLFGKSYLPLYLVTALVSSLITVVIWNLTSEIAGKRVALLASVWSVIYLFYYFYTPSPGKDIWMALFMICLVWCYYLIISGKNTGYKTILLLTVLFNAAFHLDERFFVYSPFIFLGLIWWESGGLKRFVVRKSLLFATGTIILMVPWTIRNYQQHDKIVLLSTRTESFTDLIFGYERRDHILDIYNDPEGAFFIDEDSFEAVIKGEKTTTNSGRPITRQQVEAMRKGRLPREFSRAEAFGSRLLTMFEPIQFRGRYERTGYYYYEKSLRNNLATLLFYGVPFLFSIPGFFFMFRNNRKITVIILTVIIVWALVHALTIPYTNWRYRLLLDAFFIMTGCLGVVRTYEITKLYLTQNIRANAN